MDNLPQPSSFSEDEFNGSRESWHEGKEVVGESPAVSILAAIMFLRQVKDTYMDNIEKYAEFLYLMKAVKEQRMDTAETLSRVKELFRDHQELIVGFNAFLPRGYEIPVPLQDNAVSRTSESDRDSSQDILFFLPTFFQDLLE